MREKTLTNQLSVKDNTTNEGHPLDSRNRINSLEDLVSMSGAYEGMHVYNLDDGKEYVITRVENGDIVMDSVVSLGEFINANPTAISYTEQTLNDTQKAQARQNIGAGTSNFSGSYNDLTNKPTIPDVSNKVDKEEGKGLSTNDYDNIEKGKVANAIQMPAGASANKVLGYENGNVAWVDKPSNGQDGNQGPQGVPGHNPCLGRLNVVPADFAIVFPDAIAGDYVYVDIYDSTTQTTTTTIYHYVDDTNGWDSGTVIDAEHPTLASGQAVTSVHIKNLNGVDDPDVQGVLSAEAGKELNYKIGGDYSFTLTINSTQEHSSTLDRENIYIPSGSMFRISIEAGTSLYTGSLAPSVHYVGDPSNTQLNGVNVGKSKIYKANKAIDSIGFYIANPLVGTLIITIHCYSSLADGLAHLDYLNTKGISFNPEYIAHSGRTDSEIQLIPASVFVSGKKYRLLITSDTGVTWDSETYPGTGNLIEIGSGGISPTYKVLKSAGSVSFPIVLDFISNGTKINLYSLRCLENQSIDCALYKFADFEKEVTDRISEVKNVVDKQAVTFIPIVDKDLERTPVGTDSVVIYSKTNIEVGARYKLEISTESITFDNETYTAVNLLSVWGGGLSEKKITKTESIDFPLNLSYEFVGKNASNLQYLLRCLETEKIHIRLYKLAQLETDVANIKEQLTDANLDGIVDDIDILKEKIALSPIVDQTFGPSDSVRSIYSKSSIITGAKYRIIVTSDTGITFDDETYSQYNPAMTRLITLYGGGIGDIGWKESELNLPIDITFTGDNSKPNLSLYTLRCHTNESVNIKLYKLGSIDEQLEKFEHFDDNRDLSVVHKDALEAVNVAKSYANTYSSSSGENYHIAILQMSDTHTDWTEVDRCIVLANSEHSYDLSDLNTKSKYFDILIHTGDIVEGPADLTTTNWKSRVTASDIPVLALAGNHEMAYIPNSSYNFGPNDTDIHARLYNADIVSHNGEIHPTIDGVEKNYYYKDITKNGKTIRLIGLYQFEWDVPLGNDDKPLYSDGTPDEDGVHMGGGKNIALYTQDQIDWFVQTLQAAAAAGYPVIVATHMPISAYSYVDCAFSWDGAPEPYQSMFARLTNKTFFYSIIDAFVNGGTCNVTSNQPTPDGEDNPISVNTDFDTAGKFICNICGHSHRGGIMKMIDENNNISDYYIVMNPTSSSKTVQNYGNYSRTDERTRDCFNCIVWDSYLKKFKVIRIGANLSTRMESANYFIEP